MAGFRVHYVLAAKLVNGLAEAADDKHLPNAIARHGRADLLCVDELGYMKLDRRDAKLLFQLLPEHEAKNTTAIVADEDFRGAGRGLQRPPFLRGHRRPPHLRRQHHRTRHRLLPRANPGHNGKLRTTHRSQQTRLAMTASYGRAQARAQRKTRDCPFVRNRLTFR
jgi:hypothetical protein